MSEPAPMVFIVDDDPAVRRGLVRLVRSAGFQVKTFSSSEDFLRREPYDGFSCLVLDVRMPGLDGIELHEKFIRENIFLPVIFITGFGDIPMGVKTIKNGAVDFLPKPFNDEELLAAITRAIEKDVQGRSEQAEKNAIQSRLDKLTPREHEVLLWVIKGLLNKQIAARLKIGEKTVKVHRGRVMQKMEVASVAELVRVTQKLGVLPPEN